MGLQALAMTAQIRSIMQTFRTEQNTLCKARLLIQAELKDFLSIKDNPPREKVQRIFRLAIVFEAEYDLLVTTEINLIRLESVHSEINGIRESHIKSLKKQKKMIKKHVYNRMVQARDIMGWYDTYVCMDRLRALRLEDAERAEAAKY